MKAAQTNTYAYALERQSDYLFLIQNSILEEADGEKIGEYYDIQLSHHALYGEDSKCNNKGHLAKMFQISRPNLRYQKLS